MKPPPPVVGGIMLPARRQAALRALHHSRPDVELCRMLESRCHSMVSNVEDYLDSIRRIAFHLHMNERISIEAFQASDETLIAGTEMEKVEHERQIKAIRFEEMLQEKYDSLNDRTFAAIDRCTKCNSTELRWEEKQTRSADEGASVFWTCVTCKHRWVTR